MTHLKFSDEAYLVSQFLMEVLARRSQRWSTPSDQSIARCFLAASVCNCQQVTGFLGCSEHQCHLEASVAHFHATRCPTMVTTSTPCSTNCILQLFRPLLHAETPWNLVFMVFRIAEQSCSYSKTASQHLWIHSSQYMTYVCCGQLVDSGFAQWNCQNGAHTLHPVEGAWSWHPRPFSSFIWSGRKNL